MLRIGGLQPLSSVDMPGRLAAVVFLQDMVTTLDADEDADKRAIFAAFSKPTIERVAREAGHSVVEQFSVHLHSPARQQAAA